MHSKIGIVDILIADKLGRSTIYKELERRTHETWTCTNYRLDYMKKKKFIFIETFGRANMPTVAGKLMEKHSDLFIVQWETQKKHYKKAIYGGCLY